MGNIFMKYSFSPFCRKKRKEDEFQKRCLTCDETLDDKKLKSRFIGKCFGTLCRNIQSRQPVQCH